ncbi:hypothetical protein EVAR_46411_1 [Eumeta japonica]|uniref:Uncharacterized protein n=1 Tax=Eumeta variegata TaxID=151549 RepID=A0A4C1XEN5_EUMVA|nr:hypothetical protein EVAR_46411_1 [Eumeta japonica]
MKKSSEVTRAPGQGAGAHAAEEPAADCFCPIARPVRRACRGGAGGASSRFLNTSQGYLRNYPDSAAISLAVIWTGGVGGGGRPE